ncbi:hypothetical protein N8005_07860, partial [Litorivicinus sp.]|nr:hypothetical protein [Litorivicinus sp.]
WFFLIFCFWSIAACSLLYSAMIRGFSLGASDIIEFIKLPYFLVLFSYFFVVSNQSLIDVRKLICFAGFLVLFISYICWLNPTLALLYTSTKMASIGRASAPMMNPYTLAFVCSYFLIYYSSRVFFLRGPISLFDIFCATGFAGLILLSQSRSILLAVSVAFVLSFGLNVILYYVCAQKKTFRRGVLLGQIAMLAAAGFLVLAIIDYWGLNYIKLLLNQMSAGEISESGSVSVRVEQIQRVLNMAMEDLGGLLAGFGPAKSEFRLLESGYAYVLFRHGLIGFIFYITVFVFIFIRAYRNFKRRDFTDIHYAIMVFFLGMPFFLTSSMHIEHPKASFLFFMLWGVSFGRSWALDPKIT